MSEKTVFKKIIDGEIAVEKIFEDEHCLVFPDIEPQAPTHLLIIPKKEIRSIADLSSEDTTMMGHLMFVISKVAKQLKLETGYRVVTNSGVDSGQTVDHLHFHLLAGRQLKWPPG